MQLKLILTILILGICINFISAELIIPFQPIQISQMVNEEKIYSLTLQNRHSFEVMDFTFENLTDAKYGFTFPVISISPNSTQVIDFTVNPTESYHGQINTKVSFKYLVELSDDPKTHYINITEQGFQPNYIPIRDGDTLVWTNRHEVSLDLVVKGDVLEIPVNQTTQYTFTQVETLDYYEVYFGYSGIIDIINRTSEEKAYNPNYDINLLINFNAILNPTNITLDNSKDYFEVEYGKFKKGLLTIKNTGSETAEVIELTSNSDWISFNKNNLDIEPGEEDWIEYTITPVVFSTNATDKTYEIELTAKASNSEEKIQRINIFIPFKEVTNDLGSDIDTMNWLINVFCPKFPTSFLCNQSIIGGGNGSIIYQEKKVPINVSELTIYEIKKSIKQVRDADLRTNNELQLMLDFIEHNFPLMMNYTNQSVQLSEQTAIKEKRSSRRIWGFIFFGLLILGIYLTIIKYRKLRYRKNLREGQYYHRQ
jgi:hypothetical protein